MSQLREAVGFAAFVVGAAVIAAVNHHPNHGRRTERERAAVAAAATAFTHEQIAAAWTQLKLANPEPLVAIERAFPLPRRTVHENGGGIVFTFTGHDDTCIDFLTRPDHRAVTARRC